MPRRDRRDKRGITTTHIEVSSTDAPQGMTWVRPKWPIASNNAAFDTPF